MIDMQLLMKNGFRFHLRVMDNHHDWHYRFLNVSVYSDTSEIGLHFLLIYLLRLIICLLGWIFILSSNWYRMAS